MRHYDYFCCKQPNMLKGAYSHLNYFSKFVLLITLVLSFLLFATLFSIVILVPFYGPDVLKLLSDPDFGNPSVVAALKVMQIINMTGGLLLPAVIYFWLCTPGITKSFSLKRPFTWLLIVLSFIVIIISQPLIGWASELNSYLSLPEWLSNIEQWMKDAEKQGELITEAFLVTDSVNGLILNIFMIAVLPAFAEEILFRGALTTLFKEWSGNIHFAVVLSSAIFAGIHLQFFGFLPRFLLGMALGYLFVWSGNLWLPVVAHFANNFLSVIVEFLFRKGIIHTNAENFGMENAAWITTLSLIGVSGMLYYIYKFSLSAKQEYSLPGLTQNRADN